MYSTDMGLSIFWPYTVGVNTLMERFSPKMAESTINESPMARG